MLLKTVSLNYDTRETLSENILYKLVDDAKDFTFQYVQRALNKYYSGEEKNDVFSFKKLLKLECILFVDGNYEEENGIENMRKNSV